MGFKAKVFVGLLAVVWALWPVGLSAQESKEAKSGGAKGVRLMVGQFMRPLGRYAPESEADWQQRVSETLSEKLSDAGLSVVERERIQEISKELLRAGVDIDPQQALQLGHLSGATHLLVGRSSFEVHTSLLTDEYVMVLKARVISLATGNVIKTFEAKAKKPGKYALKDVHEVEHFLESTLEQACVDLAKKVAASPPPAEAVAAAGGGGEVVEQSGSSVVEGDGQASVINGDEQQAHASAREAAIREAVMRTGRMLTRSDSQEATQELLGADPSRYATLEGAPLSEGIRDGICRTTVHVRVFLTNAPENKLAMIARLRDRGLLSMPKVMVIVPETHLARPRIPDPAVETEIVRQVRDAGFMVVDATQTARIRDEDWVRAMSSGNIAPDVLSRLKADYGADIVVTGEGISERAEADRIGAGTVRCVARAEIKAFRVDNGEMIFSDAIPSAQASGISEAIVAKSALQVAGQRISPRIVAALFQRGFGRTTTGKGGGQVAGTVLNIKIGGWERSSDVKAFLKALPGVKGVIKVEDSSFEASILNIKLLVRQEEAADFGLGLPDDPSLATFHLTITTSKGNTIDGAVKPIEAR